MKAPAARKRSAKIMDDGDRTAELLQQIVCGDALDVLRSLREGCVDCIVTSPPYYRQRNYEDESQQLGQELSPAAYIERLVGIMGECRRALSDRGTLWLVLGDKFDRGRQLGMPWRVALAMIDDGWILRSDIIWHKTNAMPSSVKNRPTLDHEYVFFFTKSKDYHYNADAVREPHVTFSEHSKMRGGRNHFGRRGGTPEQGKNAGNNNLHDARWDQAFHPQGRNKRTVWSLPLGKFRDAHFAVFPEGLVETCILAGCPEGGVVLDPFAGSGTTLLVAQKLGRQWIGIDCVVEYCRMARKRLEQATLF